MRKLSLVLSFLLLIIFPSHSQSAVYKIAHSYFRSDPFQSEFSTFLNHLLSDPTLTDKILEKKTDSSLFYFQGTYATHNPFFFKPTKVKVILTETPIPLDSLRADTVYTYQLLAYDKDSKEGVQELKKEFEKIYRRYKSGFTRDVYITSPAGSKLKGEGYNFFDEFHAVSPFAITRFDADENKEICLVLTIRMKSDDNKAVLPVPLYTP